MLILTTLPAVERWTTMSELAEACREAAKARNAGLADTPWPKFQRDSRNTGNADITTKFGVRTAPGPGGCIQ